MLLCDLDRTLFDTERFVTAIWAFVAEIHGIDAKSEQARMGEFFDWYADAYDYRFFDHLREIVGTTFDKEAFEEAALAHLYPGFLYADVTDDVIAKIDAIVTFGNEEYQSFKLSLSPRLAGIEAHIILEPKGEYLRREFAAPCVLIDDKPLVDEIAPPHAFVRILRESRENVREGELTLNDFSELDDRLRVLSDIDKL